MGEPRRASSGPARASGSSTEVGPRKAGRTSCHFGFRTCGTWAAVNVLRWSLGVDSTACLARSDAAAGKTVATACNFDRALGSSSSRSGKAVFDLV